MKRNRTKRIPSFRHHKATDQGYVVLNGTHIYLGRYDKPETRQKYHQFIAEWCANGYRLAAPPKEITVMELCAAYWQHAQNHYRRPDGTPTNSLDRVKRVLTSLREQYGLSAAAEFGPNGLRAIREGWIDDGLARTTVNDYTSAIRQVFRWATSHEMIPPQVYQGLATLEGLQAGRSAARDTSPIEPVSIAHIDHVRPFVSRQVSALVDLQLLTGARPGELLRLRAIDLDTTREVWTAKIKNHKTAHRGKQRNLYFGMKAQEVLKSFMAECPLDAHLFSPKDAAQERAQKAPTHRRQDQKTTDRTTERTLGDHYTTGSYRRAIHRACDQANVPRWSPHRLRHNAATETRKRFGLEAAQVLLGHSKADVTQIYAERDEELAFRIARERG